MTGFGKILAFGLAAGFDAAEAFITKLRLVRRATSLGHVTSLVVHPAPMWLDTLTFEQLSDAGVAPGLLRFSAGIEHEEDLVVDVISALED